MQPFEPDFVEPRRIRRSTILIGLSFLGSSVLLLWSFTLPFRQNESLVHTTSSAEPLPVQVTDASFQPKLQTDELREAALALDEGLMRVVREKNQLRPKPGRADSRASWQRRVESARQKIRSLGQPEANSLENQYRQELIESLQDAPSEDR